MAGEGNAYIPNEFDINHFVQRETENNVEGVLTCWNNSFLPLTSVSHMHELLEELREHESGEQAVSSSSSGKKKGKKGKSKQAIVEVESSEEVASSSKGNDVEVAASAERSPSAPERRHHFLKQRKSKVFECKKCTKPAKFKTAFNLKRHETEVHGGEKFVCPDCIRVFGRQWDLKNHVLKKACQGGVQFRCKKCKKNFTQKSHLNRHMKEKHSKFVKPKCPVCKQLFTREASLSVHEEARTCFAK